jgi:hypothetical protein
MALIVIDESIVGVQQTPGNGFAIQLKEMEGFPPGLTLLIPFQGEIAEEVYNRIAECMGKNPSSVLTATPSDMQKEAKARGFTSE